MLLKIACSQWRTARLGRGSASELLLGAVHQMKNVAFAQLHESHIQPDIICRWQLLLPHPACFRSVIRSFFALLVKPILGQTRVSFYVLQALATILAGLVGSVLAKPTIATLTCAEEGLQVVLLVTKDGTTGASGGVIAVDVFGKELSSAIEDTTFQYIKN